MLEKGAGIVETAISMSLVGVLVLVSVHSLGGGIRSYITSGVVPVVRGGAEPAHGDNAEGGGSSSAPSEQPNPLKVQEPETFDQSQVATYEVSYSSEGANSSTEWKHPALDPDFDWGNFDWEAAVAAGIISTPSTEPLGDDISTPSTEPLGDDLDSYDSFVAGGIAPAADPSHPDYVGAIALDEDTYQDGDSTQWGVSSEPSGHYCIQEDGYMYFSYDPCPEFIID